MQRGLEHQPPSVRRDLSGAQRRPGLPVAGFTGAGQIALLGPVVVSRQERRDQLRSFSCVQEIDVAASVGGKPALRFFYCFRVQAFFFLLRYRSFFPASFQFLFRSLAVAGFGFVSERCLRYEVHVGAVFARADHSLHAGAFAFRPFTRELFTRPTFGVEAPQLFVFAVEGVVSVRRRRPVLGGSLGDRDGQSCVLSDIDVVHVRAGLRVRPEGSRAVG
jgi:hypothetical protein